MSREFIRCLFDDLRDGDAEVETVALSRIKGVEALKLPVAERKISPLKGQNVAISITDHGDLVALEFWRTLEAAREGKTVQDSRLAVAVRFSRKDGSEQREEAGLFVCLNIHYNGTEEALWCRIILEILTRVSKFCGNEED